MRYEGLSSAEETLLTLQGTGENKITNRIKLYAAELMKFVQKHAARLNLLLL